MGYLENAIQKGDSRDYVLFTAYAEACKSLRESCTDEHEYKEKQFEYLEALYAVTEYRISVKEFEDYLKVA